MPATLRVATFLSPAMRPVYAAIAARLGHAVGMTATLVDGTDFDQFAAGSADVGFICGLPYVALRDAPAQSVELLAAPVLRQPRYGDQPVYFSDVVVRCDSRFQSFADLRGSTWAYNDPHSHSGYGVVRWKLAISGGTHGFFGKVIASGAHWRSLRMVAAGEADAAAIDTHVLAIELEQEPALAGQVRVIDTLGPSPIQPVVAARRLPPRLKAELRTALLRLSDDEAMRDALRYGHIARFVAVTDAHYDPIRLMLAAGRAVTW
jgi:phosphonate transport system substrate-binding protein